MYRVHIPFVKIIKIVDRLTDRQTDSLILEHGSQRKERCAQLQAPSSDGQYKRLRRVRLDSATQILRKVTVFTYMIQPLELSVKLLAGDLKQHYYFPGDSYGRE